MYDIVPSSPNPAPQTPCSHISKKTAVNHHVNEEEVRWLTLQLLPSLNVIEQESTHTVNMAKSCRWTKGKRNVLQRQLSLVFGFHWLLFHLNVDPVPQTTSKKGSQGNRQLLGQKDEILTIFTTNLTHTNPNPVLRCQKVTLTGRMVVLRPHPSCQSAANN